MKATLGLAVAVVIALVLFVFLSFLAHEVLSSLKVRRTPREKPLASGVLQ